MSSRIVFVLLFLAVSAWAVIPDYVPAEVIPIIDKLHNVCFPKTGVTQADVDAYHLSDKSPKMMCYMKCLLQAVKWMDVNGIISGDVILKSKFAKVDSLKPIVLKLVECIGVPAGDHPCEKSYNFFSCFKDKAAEHYYLP